MIKLAINSAAVDLRCNFVHIQSTHLLILYHLCGTG